MNERRKEHRYSVNWPGRMLLADRSIYQVSIKDISKGGSAVLFSSTLAVNTPVNLEITIPGRQPRRIRAKTIVAHHTLLSSGNTMLGLRYVEMPSGDVHLLNNVLQELATKISPA